MAATPHIKKSADLAARSVFPAAVIIFTVLIMIAVSVVWSSNRTNSDALDLERATASSSIAGAFSRLEAKLGSAAQNHGERYLDSLVTAASPLDVFDCVGTIVGAQPSIVAQRLRTDRQPPLVQTIPRALEMAQAVARDAGSGSVREHLPITLLLREQSQVAVVIIAQARGPGLLFGIRRIDPEFLTALGKMIGLTNLHLSLDSADAGSNRGVGLSSLAGPVEGALVWDPRNYGSQIMQDVLPVVLFGAAVLFLFTVLVFTHMRRMIGEMLEAEQYAKHLAGHDTLTGLSNRMSFMEQLAKELGRLPREATGIAIMFIDLDKFKEVNDTLGHAAGDMLLVEIARRLGGVLRSSDTLARLGGDEFAIVQTQVRNISDAESLARRLLDVAGEPFDLNGAEAYIGLSIGIVMAPENGVVAEDLMRYADVALYRSKSEGRNRFSFFETAMDDSVRLKQLVESDLRAAIERDEMSLLYQPQVSADGSRIVAVEALVRWNHPVEGMIQPDRFIGLAEERGLIVPLGEWVMRKALEDSLNWRSIAISVNVSAVQFKQRDFVATVARLLDETGFDPSRLEIELTESVVVDDADGAENAMMELRAMGVRLALDDFGTGYSSLIYLRRFAFDKIKIDKSFLESMEATGESAILVHSIVHLGRALGLTVTAEGVETEEQQRFLQAVGCHQLQGYHFSRPVPAIEISRMLNRGEIGPAAAA